MINVFNSPIEASTIDEFCEGKEGEEAVFEARKRRPEISYTQDGRKVVDGVIEGGSNPSNLWSATISRGVALEWKEKAGGGRFFKAKRYVSNMAYDTKVFLAQQSKTHGTLLLVLVNVFLMFALLHVTQIFPLV